MLAFKKLRPLLNRVIVTKPEPLTKTAGGILLSQDNAEQLNQGTVISVGPGKYTENGTFIKSIVKEGDIVLLPEWGGSKITLGDEKEYYLYRDDDICGILKEPVE